MAGSRILFGPFVGELGWEQSFFSGYVRRFVQQSGGKFDIHVASYPGRNVFYGDGVTFHPHPEWFSSLSLSQNAYVTDQWLGAWPRAGNGASFSSNVSDLHDRLLGEHLANLGGADRVLAPSRLFRCVIDPGKVWGTYISPLRPLSPSPLTIRIEPSHQSWDYLRPSLQAERTLDAMFHGVFNDPSLERIAVLPRLRLGRRPDKNWPEQLYRELVARLQELRPHARIILIGAPGGAYFSGEVPPPGTIDLINLPDEGARLDLQVAALRRCRFAVGGLSGAMLTVLACGTPVIEWGYAHHEPETRRQNFMRTPLLYIAENMPTLDAVVAAVTRALASPAPIDETIVAPGISGEQGMTRHPTPPLQRLRFGAFRRVDRALFSLAQHRILAAAQG